MKTDNKEALKQFLLFMYPERFIMQMHVFFFKPEIKYTEAIKIGQSNINKKVISKDELKPKYVNSN